MGRTSRLRYPWKNIGALRHAAMIDDAPAYRADVGGTLKGT
jgi:hypothetical protein